MTAAERMPLVSVEEYLAAELAREERHEYLGGYVHAMAGGTVAHARIGMNLSIALGSRLRGKPCEAFNSDAKVRVELPTQTRFYYPDGMVVCESTDAALTYQARPVLLAEVLSDSTRRIDQIEKRDAYLTIPTLALYLLIEPDRPSVTVHRRAADVVGPGAFTAELHEGLDAVIGLPEIDAELPLPELYERALDTR